MSTETSLLDPLGTIAKPSGRARAVSASACSRLDGWKEIACHLRRSIRSVQRWEKTEGLPVRRHGHQRGASVYALPEELDAWWGHSGAQE